VDRRGEMGGGPWELREAVTKKDIGEEQSLLATEVEGEKTGLGGDVHGKYNEKQNNDQEIKKCSFNSGGGEVGNRTI